MAQILHSCARTTEAVRREIQNSQESLKDTAKRYNITLTTARKWQKRDYAHDAPMGPKNPRSTVLSPEEEAIIVAFRQHTLLPLDDCLYALQEHIPRLTRSSLHRCFMRYGISRLPVTEKAAKQSVKFADYPLGYLHLDIAEVRTEKGKVYLFVAIDRHCKFVVAQLYHEQSRQTAATFLQKVLETLPYKVKIVLTDNGIQFTNRVADKWAVSTPFDAICRQNAIEHRLTLPNHPWTNGQVERMNRVLKEATVNKYYYETPEQLQTHLDTFLRAYNFAKRLKALGGLTPHEKIVQEWAANAAAFKDVQGDHTVGLYS